MDLIVRYASAFLVGGLLCVIAQILIDRTKLTSARILVIYVVSGVFLTAIGLYGKIVAFGHCGATIPLTGFGYSLCRGVFQAVDEKGFLGALTGGLPAVSAGLVMAIFLGLLASFLSKPKSKSH